MRRRFPTGTLEYSRIGFGWDERSKWLSVPFAESEYDDRFAKLRRSMSTKGLDCLIVYGGPGSASNIRYLTNFDTSFGRSYLVVPLSEEPILITEAIFHGEPMHSSVHTTYMRNLIPVDNSHSTSHPEDVAQIAVNEVKRLGARGVGYTGGTVIPAPDHKVLAGSFTLTCADKILVNQRARKSPAEQQLYRDGAKCIDKSLEAALGAIREGVSEAEIGAACAEAAWANGVEAISFTVAVGPRTCLKNVAPSSATLKANQPVLIDLVVSINGYLFDSARCAAIGTPDPLITRCLEANLQAGNAIKQMVKPGVPVHEIQQKAASVAKEMGVEEYFYVNCVGHGGGLSIVERPALSPGTDEIFEEGMVFYCEPMVIAHGLVSANTEDVCLVTETGCDVLTNCRRRNWAKPEG